MPKKLPPEWTYNFSFPLCGIDLSRAFSDQQPRQMPDNDYGKTTRLAVNVRAYEPHTDRSRGGTRFGLARYISSPVVSGWLIQELAVVVGTGFTPPGGTVQTSQSGRVVTLVAVSQGQIYTAVPGSSSWTVATNGTTSSPPLNYTGVVQSTSLNQQLWFADGAHWCRVDPPTNTVLPWTASAGTLPVDVRGNLPRLIATWRGRMVLSGLIYDPQNWFMSRVSSPTDFDYFPALISPDQAICGNNSPLGLVGDVVTCLIPYSDDVLIAGGDHTIYLFNGDPMAGGQIDRVSDAIGMAWGAPWAKDPYGTVYFLSNKMGIYSLVPGQKPQRISQPIEQVVAAYNTGQMTVRMLWDDRFQGLHVFFTWTVAAAATTHLFWDWRTGGWFLDQFANNNHNPLAVCVFDGNLPDDRVGLIGSWDGYVRFFSADATTDDGTPIAWTVVLGPLNTKDLDELNLKALQAELGSDSGDVSFSVHLGATAESALARAAVESGTWKSGRNLSSPVRKSGHAIYVRLSGTTRAAMEKIRATLAGGGKIRRRGA